MRALITGATGFIGRHLVSALLESGDELVCLIRGNVTSHHRAIITEQADLNDPRVFDALESKIGKINVVFHLAAALPSAGLSRHQFEEINGAATERLLVLANRLGASHFVYGSSLSVLGWPKILPVTEEHPLDPATDYGLSKLRGERACEAMRCSGAIAASSLRLSSPYGPGMGDSAVLPRFVAKALKGGRVEWYGSGSRAQDFVHVSDVVTGLRAAAVTCDPGVFNIASGTTLSMRALAERVTREVPGSTAHGAQDPDPQEGIVWEVAISAARHRLGYYPKIAFDHGLRDYIAFARDGQRHDAWWTAEKTS